MTRRDRAAVKKLQRAVVQAEEAIKALDGHPIIELGDVQRLIRAIQEYRAIVESLERQRAECVKELRAIGIDVEQWSVAALGSDVRALCGL